MKILIVQTVPGEIYIDKITYNIQPIGLARAFVKMGHICDIVCCADKVPSIKKVKTEDGIEITIYCVKSLKLMKNGLFMGNLESIFEKYDILQPIEYNQLYTWKMSKQYKDKVVIYHGPYYSSFNKRYNIMAYIFDIFFLRRYKKYNTMFLTKSHLATKYLYDKGIRNIKTVGVGIDLYAMKGKDDSTYSFAKKIDDFNHKYKLLYIGKIEPRRNCYFLLDILNEIIKKGLDVGLVIIGKGEHEYVKGFFDKIQSLNLYKYILYEPEIEQKNIAQIYEKTDMFLLPTIYDIYGMVLLEAMYFKQCVITTLNGGSDMMIKDGVSGFIVDSFDINEWVDRIIDVLQDTEKRLKIGEQAFRVVKNNYTWVALTRKFVKAYKTKLSKKSDF